MSDIDEIQAEIQAFPEAAGVDTIDPEVPPPEPKGPVFQEIRDWRWSDADHTRLDATVLFAGSRTSFPYTFCEEEWPDDWPIFILNPTIAPYLPPPPFIPEVVTMRQGRLAMIYAGIIEQVEDAINDMTGIEGRLARTEREYASTLRRHNPLIIRLGQSLGMSSDQVDDLFIAAAAIAE